MSGGRPHPSRPGEPVAPVARVRHRSSGREGRLIREADAAGDALVLFDGDAEARRVPPRRLDYLDGAGAPAGGA